VEAAVTAQVLHGDCLELMRDMPDASVDLILTDPPYFKVKQDAAWDHQWAKPAQFLAWLDRVLEQMQRILKPNGSLYLFASPQMAARVELLIAERFNVLNSIRWVKEAGWHKKARKEDLRSFLSPWEACIFAEHPNSDQIASGESQYHAKCDQLRGFVFESLRVYLASERDRAGFTTRMVAEAFQQRTGSRTVTGMAGHWFEHIQWALPTAQNYEWLRGLLNRHGGDYLRRDYEDLRRDYEDLRRPFSVTAEVPHTDLWAFAPVKPYRGKHPCEKPAAMLEHIIAASSRPGAVVFDAFTGTGSTGIAAVKLGRQFIGFELSQAYVETARARISQAAFKPEALPRVDIARQASRPAPMNLDLFGMEAA
jgi:site-specific DNA-methyltransferase (adenine-specific)